MAKNDCFMASQSKDITKRLKLGRRRKVTKKVREMGEEIGADLY